MPESEVVIKKYTRLIKTADSLETMATDDVSGFLVYLINHELRPGGPYNLAPSVKDNIDLNARVYNLLLKSGKSLPQVLEYVQSSGHLLDSPDDTQNTPPDNSLPAISPIHQEIIDGLAQIPPQLYDTALNMAKKIEKVDSSGEITKLSEYFLKSISGVTRLDTNTINPETLRLYGQANFYTWMAYSLYDSILDEREPLRNGKHTASAVTNLPTANVFHRLAYQTYLDAKIPPATISRFFTKVDEANAEEKIYCQFKVETGYIHIGRLPETGFLKRLLGQKSIAHCLGVYMAYNLGLKSTSHKSKPSTARRVLQQYCAARQLSDDIHDWEEDLANGRITYVTAWLLRSAKIESGAHNIHKIILKLREEYWNTCLEELLNVALDLARTAEQELIEKLNLKPDSPFLAITVQPIIKSSLKALRELKRTKKLVNDVALLTF